MSELRKRNAMKERSVRIACFCGTLSTPTETTREVFYPAYHRRAHPFDVLIIGRLGRELAEILDQISFNDDSEIEWGANR
jgi:hypothetical protein